MKISRVEALHLRLPEVKEVADGTQDVLIVRASAWSMSAVADFGALTQLTAKYVRSFKHLSLIHI